MLHCWLVTVLGGLGACSGNGWLPQLSPRRVNPLWAVAVSDTVDAGLEDAPGAYPVVPGSEWDLHWDPEDIVDMTASVPDVPNILTDGSRNHDLDASMVVAGAGAFAHTVPSGLLLWSFVHCRLYRGLSTGELSWPCRLSFRFFWGLIT